MNWKYKDNVIIALNVINKARLKKNINSRLVNKIYVTKQINKIAKDKKITLLEASELYKQQVRQDYSI